MRTIALALALLAPAAALAGQATASPEATLHSILVEINRGGFKNETDAFNRLVAFRTEFAPKRPDLLPQVNEAFIRILEQENRQSRAENNLYWKELQAAGPGNLGSAKRVTSPDEGAFLGNAIWAVASLHDPRAIPVLLEDIQTGRGAQDAIAAFGDRVVAPLLALQRTASIGNTVCVPTPPDACLASLRASALLVLARMVSPKSLGTLTAAHQAAIRNLVISTLNGGSRAKKMTVLAAVQLLGDRGLEPFLLRCTLPNRNPSPAVRFNAVGALGRMHDPALRLDLQKIAAGDPSKLVRQTAKYWLAH